MSDRAKDVFRMASIMIDGLEVIQGLTKIGGTRAAEALQAIDKIVLALHDGLDGKTTPDIVESEVKALRQAFATKDAAAEARLRSRFDNSDTD